MGAHAFSRQLCDPLPANHCALKLSNGSTFMLPGLFPCYSLLLQYLIVFFFLSLVKYFFAFTQHILFTLFFFFFFFNLLVIRYSFKTCLYFRDFLVLHLIAILLQTLHVNSQGLFQSF